MTAAYPGDEYASPGHPHGATLQPKSLFAQIYEVASTSISTVINAARRFARTRWNSRAPGDSVAATATATVTDTASRSESATAPGDRSSSSLLKALLGVLRPREDGKELSSLQRGLFGVLAAFFAIHPVFWFLETKVGIPQQITSTSMVLCVVGLFATALALPWMRLPGQEERTRAERLGATIIVWVFIALAPRFIWELPWLFFFDKIKEGVLNQSLWTYMWAPVLMGGDARYLNGDPLVVTMEWIAVVVGAFELYAIIQFFRNGKRFTVNQLGLIMSGMVVEVTLPAVYFGVEIANKLENMSSPVEMWVKFVLLNLLWCTMPILTFVWGLRRIGSQDLAVKF
ncbi:hypothetical protein [Dietzia sp. SYD-A1]|uniref:hypothetical protein n=1 Tax=Dietzia sp. SYD-A1 TaxID=2780141 RepID=UPI001890B8CC|nr:hypothetical protein [Dietzia sp. SYD-A1]